MPKASPKTGFPSPRHQPYQRSTRVRLGVPKGSHLDKVTDLDDLKEKLRTKENIVIISGAGTSTNAGSKCNPSSAARSLLTPISQRLSKHLPNQEV